MSQELQKDIETVWRILGTTAAPTANREGLVDVINTYLKAADKIKESRLVVRLLGQFFAKYPTLNSFQFKLDMEDVNGEIYLEDLRFKEAHHTHITKMSEDIYKILFEKQLFLRYLYYRTYSNEYIIEKTGINNIIDNMLTYEEKEIFYGIENFEINKLHNDIAESKKRDKLNKI